MASVTFKRGTRAEIEATAKQDGQILMETDQNKKNKMYIDLPDGSRVLIGNSGEAIDTSYDNTTSGLDATNVQNAIDELDSTVDTLNSNFHYRTAKLIVTNYSLSFDKDNVGLIIYRVSNSIHAVLAVTYFGTIGITVEELFRSQYVSYTTNGNTISFTAGGNITFIGTD